MLRYEKPHFLSGKPAPQVEELGDKPTGAKIASSLGLMVVADNRFICPSSKDLWQVKEGGIVRTSAEEVDHDEALEAADKNSPESFLASMLQDLDF